MLWPTLTTSRRSSSRSQAYLATPIPCRRPGSRLPAWISLTFPGPSSSCATCSTNLRNASVNSKDLTSRSTNSAYGASSPYNSSRKQIITLRHFQYMTIACHCSFMNGQIYLFYTRWPLSNNTQLSYLCIENRKRVRSERASQQINPTHLLVPNRRARII